MSMSAILRAVQASSLTRAPASCAARFSPLSASLTSQAWRHLSNQKLRPLATTTQAAQAETAVGIVDREAAE